MLRRIPLLADNPPKPGRLRTEALQRPGAWEGISWRDRGLCPLGLHGFFAGAYTLSLE